MPLALCQLDLSANGRYTAGIVVPDRPGVQKLAVLGYAQISSPRESMHTVYHTSLLGWQIRSLSLLSPTNALKTALHTMYFS